MVSKDLGLIIIDENQRFGVEHKEELKQMRTVDVLLVRQPHSAHPGNVANRYSRDLHLATAPEERHPSVTFAGPRTDSQITAASAVSSC